MADSDHRRGGATGAASDLLEPPVAATTAATTSASSSHSHAAVDAEEEEDGFTFAAVPRLPSSGALFPDGHLGLVYPVFGRPRSPPGREEEEEDLGSATAMVPLAQLLMEEGGTPSPSGHAADDDGGELDGVPAETYCLWSPGSSPAPGSRTPSSSSPAARCRKSGSTGSVLRWRHRVVGRSHSDGKERFVFLKESSDRSAGGGHGAWMGSGGGGKGGSGSDDRKSTFLPYKQDLVGFFANAGAFRRSYIPF